MTRTAISPRLAIRTLLNTCPSGCSGDRSPYPTAVPAPARTSERGPWRVEWFATPRLHQPLPRSTRPAAGAADGLVVVADEQTAGRGRLGRTWEAPPGVVAPGQRCCCAGADADAGPCGDGRRRWRWRRRSSRWPGSTPGSSGRTTWWSATASSPASWPRPTATRWSSGPGCNVNWEAFPAELAAPPPPATSRPVAPSTATRCSTPSSTGSPSALDRRRRGGRRLPGAPRRPSVARCGSSTSAATTLVGTAVGGHRRRRARRARRPRHRPHRRRRRRRPPPLTARNRFGVADPRYRAVCDAETEWVVRGRGRWATRAVNAAASVAATGPGTDGERRGRRRAGSAAPRGSSR